MRRHSVALLFIALACGRADSELAKATGSTSGAQSSSSPAGATNPRAESPDSSTSAFSVADTVRLVFMIDGQPLVRLDAGLDSASAEQRIAHLEAIADSASADSVAALALLRMGLLKMKHRPTLYDSTLAHRRKGDYGWDEVSASWMYTGADFDDLVAHYPRSVLVDDARYARLFLPVPGECEGDVACYIGRHAHEPFQFLGKHAYSIYAADAVGIVNRSFEYALERVGDLSQATDKYDPVAVHDLLARYDSVARKLPSPSSDSARAKLEPLLARFSAAMPFNPVPRANDDTTRTRQ